MENFKRNGFEDDFDDIIDGKRTFVRMCKETYFVNLLYEDSVYQLRYIEDYEVCPMTLASLFFEFEDLSLQLAEDIKKKFHIVAITNFSLKYIENDYYASIYGYNYDKNNPYIIRHQKV